MDRTELNFNLSTNYAVTRTIKDSPDEGTMPLIMGWGYYLPRTRTSLDYGSATWTSTSRLRTYADSAVFQDQESDEYNFNVPGLSGVFYMGHDGSWKVKCDKPVKIDTLSAPRTYPPFTPPHWTDNPFWVPATNHKYLPHLAGFVITDELGIKYEFGGSNAFNEYNMAFFNQGLVTWLCTSWQLKSITRPTGQKIEFQYERGDFVAQMYTSVYAITKYKINTGDWIANSRCNGGQNNPVPNTGLYDGKLVSPLYLKEIKADNFKITYTSTESNELRYTEDIFSTYVNAKYNGGVDKTNFLIYLYNCHYPDNDAPEGCIENTLLSALLPKLKWRKLDKIEVADANGTRIKQFKLSYNNVATERLMLKKVQELTGNGTDSLPPYEFTYYSDDTLTLPGYLKSHTDHWGYNNGIMINGVSNDFNALATYDSDYRRPAANLKNYLLGSLKQIKYPEGGTTTFYFEPHKYGKATKALRWEGVYSFISSNVAGGLRIKEIHSSTPGTPTITKKYYYLSGFNAASPDTINLLSSGVLGGQTRYYWQDYNPQYEDDGSIHYEIFSTQSVLAGTENAMGSHIGYSDVIEWSSTGGWTVYNFSNFDNGYVDEQAEAYLQNNYSAYQPCNSNAFKRGKLLKKEVFFSNGNPSSKSEYLYTLVGNLSENTVKNVKSQAYQLCNDAKYAYEATAYLITTQKFLPYEETEYLYDQDSPDKYTLSSKITAYKPNGQIKEVFTTDSKTNPEKVNLQDLQGLVYDRRISTFYKYPNDSNDGVFPAMTAKNIIGTPIEVTTSLALAGSGSVTYTPLKSTKVSYKTVNSTYLPEKVESKLGSSGSVTTDIEFLSYDLRGNLLTYVEKNGIPVKLDYFGTGTNKADLLQKKTLASGGSLSQETIYDHLPLVGVSSSTDPNAKTDNYGYDGFGRLITVKNGSDQLKASYCYNYAGQLTRCADLAPTGSIAASGLVLISSLVSLPVTLIDFQATKVNKPEALTAALLTWSTTAEANSQRFDVERSGDGKTWQKLGEVAAKGKSDSLQQYTFTDYHPIKGTGRVSENLYRLKIVDQDGSSAYSRIRSVVFDAASDNGNVALYPNPITVGEKLNVTSDQLHNITSIRFFDVTGKLVLESAATAQIATSQLGAGLYVVQITYIDGSSSTHRIVKQ